MKYGKIKRVLAAGMAVVMTLSCNISVYAENISVNSQEESRPAENPSEPDAGETEAVDAMGDGLSENIVDDTAGETVMDGGENSSVDDEDDASVDGAEDTSWQGEDLQEEENVVTTEDVGEISAAAGDEEDIVASVLDFSEEVMLAEIVDAGEKIVEYNCYGNWLWVYTSSQTLYLRGSGDMEDFGSKDTAQWREYASTINTVNIDVTDGASCTRIAKNAFRGFSALCEVHIERMNAETAPENVISIGEYAFYGCSNLKKIDLSQVGEISAYAFSFCRRLTEATLPEGITDIPDGAFWYCLSLKSVHIPDTVKSIGSYAFDECGSLTEIELPDGLEEICDYAFYGCIKLKSIQIPSTVTTILEHAFAYCYSMAEVELPDGLDSIQEYAFSGCDNLKSIWIP